MALEVPLRLSGYDVSTASGGREAIALGESKKFGVVLTDIYMPDLNGLEVVRAFRRLDPETKIIAVTAQGSLEIAMRAIEEGAFDFIAKPFNIDDVLALVARAAGHSSTTQAEGPADEADFSTSGLIGHSPQMVKAYKLTAHAARTNATVLIEGESGTGKELIARAIHRHSERAERPFTAVNCSAMTETLLESELFGYTRGSFTGAAADRAGLFESTDGGTIFLDELGGTSQSFQASLLRVLQEKEVRRIGSREARKIDVRVIGATNINLEDLVNQGDFRADLFYRLSVLTIDLPPLRERGADDIALLAHHFLKKYARDHGDRIQIGQEALDLLARYGWPGNVRELENTVERGVVLAAGDRIDETELPPQVRTPPPAGAGISGEAGAALDRDSFNLKRAAAEFEQRMILVALEAARGIQKDAARILGVKPTTLNEMLKRHRMIAPRKGRPSGDAEDAVETDETDETPDERTH